MTPSILVVDDSMVVRQQVRRTLAAAGFGVLEAADGVQALEKLKETPMVSLVVSDVNMPRMGGLELLEHMRERGFLPEMPVLMLTTEADVALVKRAKELGAKGWMVKPLKAELLVATVIKLTTTKAA